MVLPVERKIRASQFGRKGGNPGSNDWKIFISTMNMRSPIGALGLKVAPELDAVLLKQAENSQFQKNLHLEKSVTYCRVKHLVAWAEAEVQRLLTIGALSICHKPRLVHHWFVIVQKTKWRLIVDPWMLNECVVTPTAVSYEDLSVVKHLVKKGDVLWSFDLKNAYYQLWLEDWIRSFVCIKINGIYYQWNVCLLGFSWAPRVFTLVTQELLIHKMRSQGLRISRYLDDFLGASSPEKFEEEVMIAAKIFLDSGAVVSIEKSVFTGVNVLRHLGLEINSLTMNLQIPLDKLIDLRNFALSLLMKALQGAQVRRRSLASLIGKLISVQLASKIVRKYCWNLIADLHPVIGCSDWDGKVTLSMGSKIDLLWLRKNLNLNATRPIYAIQTQLLFTDASMWGWGAHLPSLGWHASAAWTVDDQKLMLYMTSLELLAIVKAVELLPENLFLTIVTDNMAVKRYVNALGGRKSANMTALSFLLFSLSVGKHILLENCCCIPSKVNLVADKLSRQWNCSTQDVEALWQDMCTNWNFSIAGLSQSDVRDLLPI